MRDGRAPRGFAAASIKTPGCKAERRALRGLQGDGNAVPQRPAVARRLGLTFEGVDSSWHVVNGVRQDVEVWSVLAEEWPSDLQPVSTSSPGLPAAPGAASVVHAARAEESS